MALGALTLRRWRTYTGGEPFSCRGRRLGGPPAAGARGMLPVRVVALEVDVNTSIIRQLNVSRVFHALREHPGSSQRDIVKHTGLDQATVSAVVAQLEGEALLQRTPKPRRGRAGRPEEALSIAPTAGWFVGIRLEPRELSVVATTLDARSVAARRLPGSSDVDVAVRRVGSVVRDLARQHGVALEAIRGVGVGIPALMNEEGYLELGPNLGWHGVPILDLLRAELPMPVYVDNDTNAAARAETLFGACRDVMDFVLVVAHSGIGSALYQGGMLLRGRSGYAGELGHVKVVPAGRACGCGGKGCLEAYASERAILARLAERDRAFGDLAEVARSAEEGDAEARAVLRDAAEKLGMVLATVVNLTNPDRIVIGGGLAHVADTLIPVIRRIVARDALPPSGRGVEVVVSGLGDDAVAMGGVALALEGFLSLPSWLSAGQLHRREDRSAAPS